MTPPVDIYETPDGLVVLADLPGVAKDGLDLRVENNLLTIRGKPAHSAPGDVVYREYDLVNFFRQFELNERVDQPKISAELKNGVLTLKLPKAAKLLEQTLQEESATDEALSAFAESDANARALAA